MELHHDEQILYRKSPSWRNQIGSHVLVLLGAILVGAVVLLAVDPDWIGIVVGIVIALIGTAWLWIERSKTKYIVTTHRLHVREGFLSKHVQETRLRRIQNVSISQSVPQRIMRVGTVDYDTAGGGSDDGSSFRMLGVEHPDALVRLVDKAQRAIFDSEREQAARAEAEADAAVRARQTERPAGPEDPTETA
jgi:uncharacterized membrane protein YdbT with pleckstrin-like domain